MPPIDHRYAATCPYCLDPVAYEENSLYIAGPNGQLEPLDLRRFPNPIRQEELRRRAYQLCPNATGIAPHYLPAPLLDAGPPLTVAMVGSSAAGKTHLLTAMLAEIDQNGLDRYGLTRRAVNSEWHNRFMRDQAQPLRAGRVLPGTAAAENFVEFSDALLIGRREDPPRPARPVTFFDLAGEDLARSDEVTAFLAGVHALIFVVDPLQALSLPALEADRARFGVTYDRAGDVTFGTVLDRIPRPDGGQLDIPVVIVVNKADLIRFEPPVDRWLGEPAAERLDPGAIARESRDTYAFLALHGGEAWLRPFKDARRCTLHFASATGAKASAEGYPPGARGRRVLEPLLAIFAMAGLLGDELLREVGR